MNFNVAVIPGDGIGPEIVAEAQKVLDTVGNEIWSCLSATLKWIWVGCQLTNTECHLQMKHWQQHKASDAVTSWSCRRCRGKDSWLRTYHLHLRPEAGLLAIRKGLNLFANLRPAISLQRIKGCLSIEGIGSRCRF
ncbi:MAG: isocitrate/isopropylmalate family dehydrogenase [Eubacterium ventriosum]